MAENQTKAGDEQAAEAAAQAHVAQEVVNRHAVYAAVGGLIPFPLVEVVTSSAVQLRMLAKLADVYGLPFSEQAVKAAIVSLVGSVLPMGTVGRTTFGLFRSVPLIGPVLGVATVPALAGAITWAVGRVFAWHFASGGSIEDFDAEASKEQFKREFREGKRRASEFVKGGGKAAGGEAAAA